MPETYVLIGDIPQEPFSTDGKEQRYLPPGSSHDDDTDASLTEWGAVCSGVCAGELWSPEERRLHTNRLELVYMHACTSPGGQQHCLFLMEGPTHSV